MIAYLDFFDSQTHMSPLATARVLAVLESMAPDARAKAFSTLRQARLRPHCVVERAPVARVLMAEGVAAVVLAAAQLMLLAGGFTTRIGSIVRVSCVDCACAGYGSHVVKTQKKIAVCV